MDDAGLLGLIPDVSTTFSFSIGLGAGASSNRTQEIQGQTSDAGGLEYVSEENSYASGKQLRFQLLGQLTDRRKRCRRRIGQ